MKKLFGLFVGLFLTTSVFAQHGGYRGHHYSNSGHWVAPFIAGAVITYVVTRPGPNVVYVPQPVYVQQPAIVYAPPPPVIPASTPSPSMVGYWYYCAELQAYFPYVATCSGPWTLVAPH